MAVQMVKLVDHTIFVKEVNNLAVQKKKANGCGFDKLLANIRTVFASL